MEPLDQLLYIEWNFYLLPLSVVLIFFQIFYSINDIYYNVDCVFIAFNSEWNFNSKLEPKPNVF